MLVQTVYRVFCGGRRGGWGGFCLEEGGFGFRVLCGLERERERGAAGKFQERERREGRGGGTSIQTFPLLGDFVHSLSLSSPLWRATFSPLLEGDFFFLSFSGATFPSLEGDFFNLSGGQFFFFPLSPEGGFFLSGKRPFLLLWRAALFFSSLEGGPFFLSPWRRDFLS